MILWTQNTAVVEIFVKIGFIGGIEKELDFKQLKGPIDISNVGNLPTKCESTIDFRWLFKFIKTVGGDR